MIVHPCALFATLRNGFHLERTRQSIASYCVVLLQQIPNANSTRPMEQGLTQKQKISPPIFFEVEPGPPYDRADAGIVWL